jgi:hypothetical protein
MHLLAGRTYNTIDALKAALNAFLTEERDRDNPERAWQM